MTQTWGENTWGIKLGVHPWSSWLVAHQSCTKLLQPLSHSHATAQCLPRSRSPLGQWNRDWKIQHTHTKKVLRSEGKKIIEHWENKAGEEVFTHSVTMRTRTEAELLNELSFDTHFFHSSVDVFLRCETIWTSLLTSLWTIIHAQLSGPVVCAPEGAWQIQLKTQGLILQQVEQAGDEKPNQIRRLRSLTQEFIVNYDFFDALVLSLTCFALKSSTNSEKQGSLCWTPKALTPQIFCTKIWCNLSVSKHRGQSFLGCCRGGGGDITQQQWLCRLCSRSPSPLPRRSCSQTWPLLW